MDQALRPFVIHALCIPSRRHSSAILSSPRRPSSKILIFSPTISFNILGSILALFLIRHIFQQAHSKHQWDCCGLVLRRIGIGIGIGMELLRLKAGWTCDRFDAAKSRLVAVIARAPGGRAERCVIVTCYLRTKFFRIAPSHRGCAPLFWLMGPTVSSYILFCASD
jgi:hypothetical protein